MGRRTNKMKKQGNKVLQTNQATPIRESIEEMSEKEFWMYLVKMFYDLKNYIREQAQEFCSKITESLQEMKDHFCKDILEVLRRNKDEIIEGKESLNQLKSSMESITHRQDHLEDRTSGNEDKIYNLENKVDHG